MRKLSTEKRTTILGALVEGNSINAAARLCDCSKVTVLRLLADAGTVAAAWHDEHVRELHAERVQADEIWSFGGAKDKAVKAGAAGRRLGLDVHQHGRRLQAGDHLHARRA